MQDVWIAPKSRTVGHEHLNCTRHVHHTPQGRLLSASLEQPAANGGRAQTAVRSFMPELRQH